MIYRVAVLLLSVAVACDASADVVANLTPADFADADVTIDFESQVDTALPTSDDFTFLSDFDPHGGSTKLNATVLFGDNIFVSSFGVNPTYKDLGLVFTTPATRVGMYVQQPRTAFTAYASELKLSAFDFVGNLLGETTVVPPPVTSDTPAFFGLASTAEPIKMIVVTGNHNTPEDAGFFAVDNIMFDQVTAVPEPNGLAAMSAISVIIVACIWIRRIRQTARLAALPASSL